VMRETREMARRQADILTHLEALLDHHGIEV